MTGDQTINRKSDPVSRRWHALNALLGFVMLLAVLLATIVIQAAVLNFTFAAGSGWREPLMGILSLLTIIGMPLTYYAVSVRSEGKARSLFKED